MHKITRNVMAAEEPLFPTVCGTDPERWFPDEQKPDPYAVAACWSCHFQSGCARRALAQNEEFGVWGGYRLAPGPSLERRRDQLRIIAGYEMGPAASPGAEVTAALTTLADIERGVPAELAEFTSSSSAAAAAVRAAADDIYPVAEIGSTLVELDEWREPTLAELAAAADDERAALEYPVTDEELIGAHGQILLPLDGWETAAPAPALRRRRSVSARCGSTATTQRAS